MANSLYNLGQTNPNPIGQTIVESKTEADAASNVVTFDHIIFGIEIFNADQTNNAVCTVNGIQITVAPNVIYRSSVGGSSMGNTVTVTGSTSYEVRRVI